ncbi:hypothetical protein [Tenacibaculum maritimum]|uniref:hypothetical protein n=1 Tax=Tenacibaculum maritimum TaxID=107401 RepID=UPI00387685E6
MKFLKQFFDFYINASIHVALAVYSLLRITERYVGLSYNESLDYFIFYGTIVGYNFVKYAGVTEVYHGTKKTLKKIRLFSLISLGIMCYYGTHLSVATLALFIPFGGLTLLYAIPFLSGFQKNLRSISYLKIIIVAIVWVGLTVVLPVFDKRALCTLNIGILGVQRFLMILILILPFEIRDVAYDEVSLQTIPRKLGVEKTKKLGYALLLITVLLEFIIAPNTAFRNAFLVVFLLQLFLLMRATVKQSTYYSSFFVESIPIIWWFILLWN